MEEGLSEIQSHQPAKPQAGQPGRGSQTAGVRAELPSKSLAQGGGVNCLLARNIRGE